MAESISALASHENHEGRRHDRTHMFVAATLYSNDGSCPVNIRNMSLCGALIEGAVLPEREVPVTLRRGSLEAKARVVWTAGRRAGVSFSGTVQVSDWMSRNPICHQSRIDEIVRGIRSGTSGRQPAPAPAELVPTVYPIDSELRALKEELTQLEKGLTNDIVVVATHPEIQLLDICLQRIERMLTASQPR
jgi:hypothetical protein